jgi:hypothetical protein
MKDEEEDLPSVWDSAYYSLDQSYCKSEIEVLEETETVDKTCDITSTLSRTSSFTTSPIPILTTHSVTRKAPKKSVTIILPQTRKKGRPFGDHLQIENGFIFNGDKDYRLADGHAQYIQRSF